MSLLAEGGVSRRGGGTGEAIVSAKPFKKPTKRRLLALAQWHAFSPRRQELGFERQTLTLRLEYLRADKTADHSILVATYELQLAAINAELQEMAAKYRL